MNDPLAFDPQRLLVNVRQANTEDLLDRVTAFRAGMEPEAVDIIETELKRRGLAPGDIASHGARTLAEAMIGPDGLAVRCSFCDRPAVQRAWGWHRLFKLLPVFPRPFRYCRTHWPAARS